MGNAEIDAHILAACNDRWLKTARVIAEAASTTTLGDKPWGHEAVAKRVRTLVKKRRLEAAGDIWDWRGSEVRLSPATSERR
jgi:hypothetical protein